MTKSDIKLISVVLVFAIAFAVFIYITGKSKEVVVIKKEGKIVYRIKLPLDKNMWISSEDGVAELMIKGKKIRFIKSTCPQKYCIKQGWLNNSSTMLICMPLKIQVYFGAKDFKTKVDAITQ